MADLSSIAKANEGVKGLVEKPVAVFVGGTSGIGEHTAYNFAQYTDSPTIYIIGRNQSAGDIITKKLKTLNPNCRPYFIQKELTLITECDTLCDYICGKETKVNLLFLSPGYLTASGRNETIEGNDKKLAINYYSRWRIVNQLLPLLEQSANNNENTRVVSVLQPGDEGPIEEDDLALRHKFSLVRANRHIVEFNSLAVARFGKLYPDISFSHAHPGIVATGSARQLPWVLRVGISTLKYFMATSKEDAAQKMFYLGWTGEQFKTGPHIVDAELNELLPDIEKKGFLEPELQETVWNHTEDVFKASIN